MHIENTCAVERLKLLKYGALKYRWLKGNGIETRQVVGHVAASTIIPIDKWCLKV
jgi:hypothetical protein